MCSHARAVSVKDLAQRLNQYTRTRRQGRQRIGMEHVDVLQAFVSTPPLYDVKGTSYMTFEPRCLEVAQTSTLTFIPNVVIIWIVYCISRIDLSLSPAVWLRTHRTSKSKVLSPSACIHIRIYAYAVRWRRANSRSSIIVFWARHV